jgi:UDP-2,4-diacetamido-2,4,6-trideoxy-beta-L-altropyranose hydrolase
MKTSNESKPDHDGLLIRADASTRLGAGHAMRCFALAKAWQKTGGRVTFAMSEALPGMRERFRNEGVQLEYVSPEAGSKEDAKQTGALAERIGARWTVVDGYQFAPDYVRQIRDSGLRVLVLDDDARFSEYCADVILNQNPGADEQMYGQRRGYTRLLLGADYALLRPEFLAASQHRETSPVAYRVLVCMGGSDPENVTETAMQAVADIGGEIETTVVVGSGNPHHQQLCALADIMPGVRIERSPTNMADLMREADTAISAAGSTCWELAYLGVPMILTVLASNQQANAQALAKHGAALNLGWHSDLSPSEISKSIEQLAGDCVQRRAMSKAGRKLVDGHGAERVVKILESAS